MSSMLLPLMLWASLVSVELTGGLTTMISTRNLSCFQCFKTSMLKSCTPVMCQANEKVCLSNHIIFVFKTVGRSVSRYSKRCANRCSSSNSVVEWSPFTDVLAKITRGCCGEDLCNRVPDTRALPGRLLLSMVLGLFCILL